MSFTFGMVTIVLDDGHGNNVFIDVYANLEEGDYVMAKRNILKTTDDTKSQYVAFYKDYVYRVAIGSSEKTDASMIRDVYGVTQYIPVSDFDIYIST